MADYIAREDVKELLEQYGAAEDALTLIDTIPAADVVEVKYGQWIVTDVDWGYSDAAGKNVVSRKYACSVCGYETGDQGEKFVCCPMCMSRIGKEGEHEIR